LGIASWWRRVRRRGMDREQAAVEIAAAFRSGTAVDEDDLLRTRGERVYDEMLTDAQVQSALTTKKFGILDADWQSCRAARTSHRSRRRSWCASRWGSCVAR